MHFSTHKHIHLHADMHGHTIAYTFDFNEVIVWTKILTGAHTNTQQFPTNKQQFEQHFFIASTICLFSHNLILETHYRAFAFTNIFIGSKFIGRTNYILSIFYKWRITREEEKKTTTQTHTHTYVSVEALAQYGGFSLIRC